MHHGLSQADGGEAPELRAFGVMHLCAMTSKQRYSFLSIYPKRPSILGAISMSSSVILFSGGEEDTSGEAGVIVVPMHQLAFNPSHIKFVDSICFIRLSES